MEKVRKVREYQRSKTEVFVKAAEVLGLTHSALTVRLGYADNSCHGWLSSGEMPLVAARLCEAMIELREVKTREKAEALGILVVLPKSKAQLETATAFFKAVGIETLQTIL